MIIILALNKPFQNSRRKIKGLKEIYQILETTGNYVIVIH